MTINFPQSDDIKLGRSPLVEVVCQVRIPPILRIGKETPADFQDRVRQRFPELEVEQGLRLQVSSDFSDPSFAAEPTAKIFRLSRDDGASKISLAPDFYALSTNDYEDWAEFREDLQLCQDSFREVYQPPYARRIGLRYINRISPTNTGIESLPEIVALIREELIPNFETDAWQGPKEMRSRLVIPAQGDSTPAGNLKIQTAFAREDPHFLLDFDYFEEGRISLEGFLERLDGYHNVIYDAFRWSIVEDRFEVFQPMTGEG